MAKPNWTNRTMWTGDNLDIMRGMNSESVDLIYLDPPFNSNRNYAAPIGSKAAGAAFKDTWTRGRRRPGLARGNSRKTSSVVRHHRRGQGSARQGDAILSDHDGGAPTGDAAVTQGDRFDLSALRSDGQPLSETNDTCPNPHPNQNEPLLHLAARTILTLTLDEPAREKRNGFTLVTVLFQHRTFGLFRCIFPSRCRTDRPVYPPVCVFSPTATLLSRSVSDPTG